MAPRAQRSPISTPTPTPTPNPNPDPDANPNPNPKPGASSGEWGIDAFKAAWRSERRLVQLGVQDRMLGAIFAIRTTCSRAWLPGVEMGEPGS